MRVWLMKAISGLMRVAATTIEVVALGRAFLAAFARDDRAIEVHRHRTPLICENNHFCSAGNTAVLRPWENVPKKRLLVLWLGRLSQPKMAANL